MKKQNEISSKILRQGCQTIIMSSRRCFCHVVSSFFDFIIGLKIRKNRPSLDQHIKRMLKIFNNKNIYSDFSVDCKSMGQSLRYYQHALSSWPGIPIEMFLFCGEYQESIDAFHDSTSHDYCHFLSNRIEVTPTLSRNPRKLQTIKSKPEHILANWVAGVHHLSLFRFYYPSIEVEDVKEEIAAIFNNI
jgi:hypothetical protein